MFKIKRLREDIKLPVKTYNGDAGFDVYSPEKYLIGAGMWLSIPLGFAMEIPPKYVAMVSERSGMAKEGGFFTIGNIIDSTYRGEVHAILANLSPFVQSISKGSKIAQILVFQCYTGTEYAVVKELSKTTRGNKGFGSTGK